MNLREGLVLAAGELALPGFRARASAFGAGGPDRLAGVNRLLAAARAGVPGYAAEAAAAGLTGGLSSLDELARVPPVTRGALAAAGGRGSFARLASGGTAGAPRAETRLDLRATVGRYAALLSVLKAAGWRMGERTAALHPEEYGYFNNLGAMASAGRFGGIVLEFFQQYVLYRLLHGRRNLLYGGEIFSDPAAALELAARAAAQRPALLISRPDALMAVLKALRGRPDPAFPGLKAVLTVGTALGEAVRLEARRRLGAEVFNMYASTELGYVALSCPHSGDWLHADEGWHIVESSGGELVCTDLGNELTPLLRYATGDAGEAAVRTCACGRAGLMLRVRGRAGRTAGGLYEADVIDRTFAADLPFFQLDPASGRVTLPAGREAAAGGISALLGGRWEAAPGAFKMPPSGKFSFLP